MADNKSRTQHVVQNASIGLLSQIVTTVLSFVSRTFFIYILGKEYLGISGLFTNILMILSFAELGIGNAMVYSMYNPVKEGDTEKIKSLLLLYKKSYRYIGISVAVIGLAIIPFLDMLIHGTVPNVKEPIILLYVLFLINSVISYFYAYKQSIVIAAQEDYIVTLNSLIVNSVCFVIQIGILLVTGNYILFLLCTIFATLLTNLSISRIADKRYPELTTQAIPLAKYEVKKIFSNVKSLAVYKLGSVTLNGTGNIMISWLFNVSSVGIYANYLLFTSFFQTVNTRIMGAFTSSVGNLNAGSSKEKQYIVFNSIFFLSCWINGFASVMLMLFANDIILIWIGEEYVFDNLILFGIFFHHYIFTTSFAPYVFRTTLGLFKQGQLAPILATVLNISLGILLAKLIGIAGIFFGTAIARMLSTGIIDPVLIFKKVFNRSVIDYYKMFVLYIIVFSSQYYVILYLISFIHLTGVMGLIVKGIAAVISFNVIFCALFWKTTMLVDIKYRVTKMFYKKK